MGATTEETPIPNPPINLKKEKEYGFVANAVPIADKLNKIPTLSSTFFLPNFSVGNPPKIAPITVPHKAMDIIKNP